VVILLLATLAVLRATLNNRMVLLATLVECLPRTLLVPTLSRDTPCSLECPWPECPCNPECTLLVTTWEELTEPR